MRYTNRRILLYRGFPVVPLPMQFSSRHHQVSLADIHFRLTDDADGDDRTAPPASATLLASLPTGGQTVSYTVQPLAEVERPIGRDVSA